MESGFREMAGWPGKSFLNDVLHSSILQLAVNYIYFSQISELYHNHQEEAYQAARWSAWNRYSEEIRKVYFLSPKTSPEIQSLDYPPFEKINTS